MGYCFTTHALEGGQGNCMEGRECKAGWVATTQWPKACLPELDEATTARPSRISKHQQLPLTHPSTGVATHGMYL